MEITYKNTEEVIPYINNPRQNDHAVDKVASSIKNYGFRIPIVIDEQNEIIAGHTRVKAAKKLGMEEIPAIIADDLSDAQKKAFRIADNKTGELAEWDMEQLKVELEELEELDIDMEELGFDEEELEKIKEQIIVPDEEPEYDENIADDVKMTTCPECGHEYPV